MNLKMKVSEVDSSTISSIEWARFNIDVIDDINKITGFLRVTFKNNVRYVYKDVPLVKALAVLNPSGNNYSVGSNFNEHIKSANYEYTKE